MQPCLWHYRCSSKRTTPAPASGRNRLRRPRGNMMKHNLIMYRRRQSRRDAESVGRSRPCNYSPPEAVPARRRVCGAVPTLRLFTAGGGPGETPGLWGWWYLSINHPQPTIHNPPNHRRRQSRPNDYSPPGAVPARRRVCGVGGNWPKAVAVRSTSLAEGRNCAKHVPMPKACIV